MANISQQRGDKGLHDGWEKFDSAPNTDLVSAEEAGAEPSNPLTSKDSVDFQMLQVHAGSETQRACSAERIAAAETASEPAADTGEPTVCPALDNAVSFCKRCGFPSGAEFCPGCGSRQCAGCGDL